jgi:hypothetical protein
MKNSTADIRMDWYFILYVIMDMFLGIGMVYYMYRKGQSSGAITLFVMLLLIFIFFGLRWFDKKGNIKKAVSSSLVKTADGSKYQYPPNINLCPDYYGIFTDKSGTSYCYDINNTYNLKYSTVLGQTRIPSFVDNSDVVYGYPTKTACATFLKNISMDGDYNVRWEGIWDGMDKGTCPGVVATGASGCPVTSAEATSCMLF